MGNIQDKLKQKIGDTLDLLLVTKRPIIEKNHLNSPKLSFFVLILRAELLEYPIQ